MSLTSQRWMQLGGMVAVFLLRIVVEAWRARSSGAEPDLVAISLDSLAFVVLITLVTVGAVTLVGTLLKRRVRDK